MIKAQIELPEELYVEAQRVAKERGISLEEVVRRGLEYMTSAYPAVSTSLSAWSLPPASDLGECRVGIEQWHCMSISPDADPS